MQITFVSLNIFQRKLFFVKLKVSTLLATSVLMFDKGIFTLQNVSCMLRVLHSTIHTQVVCYLGCQPWRWQQQRDLEWRRCYSWTTGPGRGCRDVDKQSQSVYCSTVYTLARANDTTNSPASKQVLNIMIHSLYTMQKQF